ncbi:MAG: 23S rRNA (uridine(2552)-2'-O)-methyltransferase [Candidatus Thorarchaeota archaeon]|nr:MAG: 23S rRNA (uridine(2552)-2'-O)-methyltransferase [Candidatus Thorarchaeota archaeon]
MGRPKEDRKKEHYYRAAKKEGYRSRSAYKIKQAIGEHKLLKGVNKVLELCCCPGGWTQVLHEINASLEIVAVDLSAMLPIEGVAFIQGDITAPETLESIERSTGGSVDLVLSDCSPNVSGNWELDVARQLFLAEVTIEIALRLLSGRGKVFLKVFQGKGFQEFVQSVRTTFQSVRLIKPEASRKTSAEIYLLAEHPIKKRVRNGAA